jgi:N-acetylneuraminic acid mutarotase
MGRIPITALPRLWIAFVFLCGMVAPGATHAQSVGCGDPIGPSPTQQAASSEGWSVLPEMPRPRSEFAAGVIDGWIYVVGGFGGSAMMDCFHPASGTWAVGSDLPVGVHHPGVTVLDGILYVAGGYTDEGPSTDALWAYDPATGEWQERAPMPTSRGALGLAPHAGAIYAIGGALDHLGGPVTGVVEIYDPETDEWTSGGDMPTPREHVAVVAGDDHMYTVGGRANGDDSDHISGIVEAYDPATQEWESLPSLPTPRGGLSGVYANGMVIVLGGEQGTTTFDTVEAFDVAAGEWIILPPLPTARHGIASAVVGDTLYAIAGSTLGGRVENTGETNALPLP